MQETTKILRVSFAAPAALSVCTLIAGCMEPPSDNVSESPPAVTPSAIVEASHRRPSASDCIRDRIAEFRKMHGANAPILGDRVAEWLEYCQGT